MDLTRYAEELRNDLAVAAEAGGEEARALAERLTAALEPATRLMLLEALSDAAGEITRELAPGSVELRLRAGEAEFAVVAPRAPDAPARDADLAPPAAPAEPDDGAVARINLRLPEQLKSAVEQAAASERLSVNAWLVRAVSAAVAGEGRGARSQGRGGQLGQSFAGWVR
jgi:HicB family